MVKQRHRITSYDVAEAAGVSQSTVSRALSGDPIVAEATRNRILDIARSLNYHIDAAASRTRSGRIETIAVVMICPEHEDVRVLNPFHYGLLAAICAAASQRGLETIVSFQGARDRLKDSYEQGRRAMGIIVIGTSENHTAWNFFRNSAQSGTHIVCWGAPYDDLDWVRADNQGGAALAVEHLLAQGYRSIAYVGDNNCPQRQFAERYAGYVAAMEQAGQTPRLIEVAPGLSRHEQGRRAAQALLASGQPFDAIFAACDDLALGAMAVLEERGLAVPGDVGVVGFDGVRSGAIAVTPLSTIEPDFAAAGEVLVERMLASVAGELAPRRRVPVSLVVRESSAAAAPQKATAA